VTGVQTCALPILHVTLYQETPVVLGLAESSLIPSPFGIYIGLHTFVHYSDAENLVNNEWIEEITSIIIVEVIIPKGARCYMGTFIDIPSYASDKLLYTNFDDLMKK
jgi:hypothetical protein